MIKSLFVIRLSLCKKLNTFLFVFLFFMNTIFSADTLRISPNLYLLKLTENTFIHTSMHFDKEWGRFGSNGMIVIDNGEVALFDTPMDDSLSQKLINFIQDSLKAKIKFFVPNHWHADCTAGMDLLDSTETTFISSSKTLLISQQKKIRTALISFKENYSFTVGKIKIECAYLGEAHSTDNIVTYISSEKILFGGCMMKTLSSTSKGNVEDANLKEWPKTLKKVKKKYKKAEIVVPGHGDYGDIEIISHSIKIIKNKV